MYNYSKQYDKILNYNRSEVVILINVYLLFFHNILTLN